MKLYSKKERIMLITKSFPLVFLGTLFIKYIIEKSINDLITNFFVSLGVSIGIFEAPKGKEKNGINDRY